MTLTELLAGMDADTHVAIGCRTSFLYVGPAGDFRRYLKKIDKVEKDNLKKKIGSLKKEIEDIDARILRMKDPIGAARLNMVDGIDNLKPQLDKLLAPYIKQEEKRKKAVKASMAVVQHRKMTYQTIAGREVMKCSRPIFICDAEPLRVNIVVKGEEDGRFWFASEFTDWIEGRERKGANDDEQD